MARLLKAASGSGGEPAAPSGGNDGDCPSRQRPIDLVHLARQTAGDRTLEVEVLGLLIRQIELVGRRLDDSGVEESRQIAHALKGSARNVGAFRLADAAGRFEQRLADPVALSELRRELAAAAAFARTLSLS
ncbi:Hpt domain-containing protein [Jiella sp. M17.18]|uniref:Hpt domain-containing protein n=1 Tax=Jiella sp. M17.18 TaxID=3234247 RepID=UPI0034DF19B7